MSMSLKEYEQFIKLMGMTSSQHDGEALNAMRLAWSLMAKHNIGWEEILRGKVTVTNQVAPFGPGSSPSSIPQGRAVISDAEARDIFETLDRTVKGGFRDFVESIRTQWETEGWMSLKQHAALKKAYDRVNPGGWQNV